MSTDTRNAAADQLRAFSESFTEWCEQLQALTAMTTLDLNALGATLSRMGCHNPRHPKETTTRTGWTVHWLVCPRCVTGRRA